MPRSLPLAAAFAALAAACAPVEEPPETVAGLSTERQCFFSRQVDGYGDAPDGRRGDRIYVTAGFNDRWLLETFGSCPSIDWTHAIALDTRGPSSLCTGDIATLIVPRGLDRTPDRCTARVLGKMTAPR